MKNILFLPIHIDFIISTKYLCLMLIIKVFPQKLKREPISRNILSETIFEKCLFGRQMLEMCD